MKSKSEISVFDKLTGYVGLGFVLVLAFFLFVFPQKYSMPSGVKLLVDGKTSFLYTTIPGQLVLSSGIFDDVIAYKTVERDCLRTNFMASDLPRNGDIESLCGWEFVLFKAAMQETSLSSRDFDFREKAHDIFERLSEESTKFSNQGGIVASPFFGDLIVQRDSLLEIVERNVEISSMWVNFGVLFINAVTAIVLFVLILFRRMLGWTLLLPFRAFFEIGKEVHKQV